MQIKVLCLHGMGVNADVFSSQTASFRAVLPPYYTFDFFDADELCDASPGAADFCAGPYRCWYVSPSTERVARAHDTLQCLIDEHGPYDIIMGFSQGAALAASFLLHRQLERKSMPVRAGIFICSPLPFSTTIDNGLDCRPHFGIRTPSLPGQTPTPVPACLIPESYFLRGDRTAGALGDPLRVRPDMMRLDSGISSSPGDDASSPAVQDCGPYYNMFHPTRDIVRLELPTAHIYGSKDSWRHHGIALVELCVNAIVLQHDGHHEIPSGFSDEIADLILEITTTANIH